MPYLILACSNALRLVAAVVEVALEEGMGVGCGRNGVEERIMVGTQLVLQYPHPHPFWQLEAETCEVFTCR